MGLNIFIWFIVAFCVDDQLAFEENPYLRALSENRLAQNTSYGFVEVRPGAHIFYWLYYADGSQTDASDKPLIIWLQGGPTFGASGIGNFGEIGPLTMDFKPRNHTWVKGRNVLFIDEPVGSGFSYVTSQDLEAKSDHEMVEDLSQAIKLFLEKHENFRKTPTYVIGQHYGGKLCPILAMNLHKAIKSKSLEMNFKGIGIGGGWVNPKESILAIPNFLYQSGFMDREAFLNSTLKANDIISLMAKNETIPASLILYSFDRDISNHQLVNLYNIYGGYNLEQTWYTFGQKMEKFVKPTLIGVKEEISWMYFNTLINMDLLIEGSIYAPSVSFLEDVLTETNLKVAIYNGNYDAQTPLSGASHWVHNLNWPFKDDFTNVGRHPIRGKNNGYYKVMKQLSFWSVFRAGHWVPVDNPEAMEHVLEYLMTDSGMTTAGHSSEL